MSSTTRESSHSQWKRSSSRPKRGGLMPYIGSSTGHPILLYGALSVLSKGSTMWKITNLITRPWPSPSSSSWNRGPTSSLAASWAKFSALGLVKAVSMYSRPSAKGGKVSLNSFVHPNQPILIEPKPTQLLVRLNGHQPNEAQWLLSFN